MPPPMRAPTPPPTPIPPTTPGPVANRAPLRGARAVRTAQAVRTARTPSTCVCPTNSSPSSRGTRPKQPGRPTRPEQLRRSEPGTPHQPRSTVSRAAANTVPVRPTTVPPTTASQPTGSRAAESQPHGERRLGRPLAPTGEDLLDRVGDWGQTATVVGAFHLIPVRLDRDLPLISRWMNDPAVAAFWEALRPRYGDRGPPARPTHAATDAASPASACWTAHR